MLPEAAVEELEEDELDELLEVDDELELVVPAAESPDAPQAASAAVAPSPPNRPEHAPPVEQRRDVELQPAVVPVVVGSTEVVGAVVLGGRCGLLGRRLVRRHGPTIVACLHLRPCALAVRLL